MITVAVTGASGFVGRHLCRALVAAGHAVRPIRRVELVGATLTSALSGAGAVVHLASLAHVLSRDSVPDKRAYMESILHLTDTVAQAAVAAGIGKFIYMSSAGVLGVHSPPEGFAEDSPPNPHDDYSEAKLQAEILLRQTFPGSLRTVILRPPLIYGHGAKGNFPRLLRAALSGWPLPLAGLTAPRSIIGVRNVTDAIIACIADARCDGSTLLLADAEAVTVPGLLRRIGRVAGRPSRLFFVPPLCVELGLRALGRAADIERLLQPFLLRPTRARQLINWTPPYSLDEELRQALAAGPLPGSTP